MPAKLSAALLLYRERIEGLEVLLVHPGGPFWARKDEGAWSIPKGEYEAGKDPLQTARREFEEELGVAPPGGPVIALGDLLQPSRKRVTAFAIMGEFDPAMLRSNLFELEWPPKSGTLTSFPEVDRAAWFTIEDARRKILPGQRSFLDVLETKLGRQ